MRGGGVERRGEVVGAECRKVAEKRGAMCDRSRCRHAERDRRIEAASLLLGDEPKSGDVGRGQRQPRVVGHDEHLRDHRARGRRGDGVQRDRTRQTLTRRPGREPRLPSSRGLHRNDDAPPLNRRVVPSRRLVLARRTVSARWVISDAVHQLRLCGGHSASSGPTGCLQPEFVHVHVHVHARDDEAATTRVTRRTSRAGAGGSPPRTCAGTRPGRGRGRGRRGAGSRARCTPRSARRARRGRSRR